MAFSAWRTWSTGEVVTAAHLNQEVRDNGEALFPDEASAASWSPTLAATGSNPSTSSVSGRQYQVGALMFVWARFVLSSGGDGTYTVSLPTAASGITANATHSSGQVIGVFHGRDDSGDLAVEGNVLLRNNSSVHFMMRGVQPDGAGIDHNTPVTWASGDIMSFHAVYPVA